MIISITMNPSIDISYPLETLHLDTVNRVTNVTKTAGGKGLNVARVLHQSGADILASGLIGGHFGASIQEKLSNEGICHHFFMIEGETRNCMAILHQGKQTEILEQGPSITNDEAKGFLSHFDQIIEQASMLTFSGSLPAGLPDDYYKDMIDLCYKKHKPVVLDCSGGVLQNSLKGQAKPLLIKPNREELVALLGRNVKNTIPDLKEALMSPLFDGIEWVVVSLGADGVFAKHRDTFYQVGIPPIEVVNPVGSGDAMIAGLAQALDYKQSDEKILKHGNVLGMLNAQEKVTGQVNMQNYRVLFEQIQIKKV
ncbi:tagatose-6-phosphate kinase [Tetragenococcus halophilus]|uniref:Tagatose-6-phosphate kinase n=1 Tax=Tetragenococcus halophilus TaxID=51669 RepID=A0A3G5FG97_TETHA|nr:tagatose-6-phosphate kinase [Tetragenococcus halophilus]AYW49255.1 tagatose-6-phosphate kinase [Tetragenococcus halophilus]GBD63887.1 tagatose-6-phosphate kinase [Tetragenococcus halophilus subsp. flandriensis]